MSGFLNVDIASFKAQWDELLKAYPELAEDEELRVDVLEAETDLHRLAGRILDMKLTARAMAAGAKLRRQELNERIGRFERQEDAYTALLHSLMATADVQKLTLPEATVSITKPRKKVNIIDINELPQGFYEVARKAMTAEIKSALEAGEHIPGAELVLGDEGLMVRTK